MAKKPKPKRRAPEPFEPALPPLPSTELARIADDDDYRYLDNGDDPPAVVLTLTPPDFTRCQCEWPDATAPTFGPKPMIRCDQTPTTIAFQKRLRDNPDPTGMVALCDEHRVMVEHMWPGQCYFRQITLEKKMGDLL